MSTDGFSIPRHGKAGVAFLGVQLNDAAIFIASIILGVLIGAVVGWGGYIAVPAAGYFVNKAYLDWKGARLPGYLRAFLFTIGLAGYSDGFKHKDTIYIGDGVVINTGSTAMLDAITSSSKGRNGTQSA